jgi:hypothetical protein
MRKLAMASEKRAQQGYGRWCAFATAQMIQCLSGQWRKRKLAASGPGWSCYILGMSKIKYADPTMPLEERCERLNTALNQTLDKKEALEAELARVRGRLDALMTAFDENGTLGILQLMAHDKTLPPEIRIRAAGLAVPYEKPKLSMAVTTSVPLYDLLEERRRKGKLIEHDPSLIFLICVPKFFGTFALVQHAVILVTACKSTF